MNSPFFSVVIPTHNRYSLLKRAVKSVLSQTYQNFELLVIDDHSSDETSMIIKQFSDPRIIYKLNNRSKGACGARNTGICSAKGKWVAFLDDDDIWFPEKLKYQYDLINNSGESIGLVCADYLIYKGKNRKPRRIKNRPKGWIKDKILFGGCIGSLSSICIKKNILKSVQGFDEIFPACQDKDLWFRVAEVSKFASVPKTLVCSYQEKRDRISHNHKNKLNGHILLRIKFSEKINKNPSLKHRYESPIFIYGLILKRKNIVVKSMPWFFLGIIIDFPYCLRQFRTAILLFYRFRTKIINTPWK